MSEYVKNKALLSVYAGAGGVDAQDWASMLFRMYQSYAQKRGWQCALLNQSLGEQKGIKSASAEMKGDNAYELLKNESGVHRLVRISPFSAKKLRHTSFALVEALPELPELEEKKLTIPDEDLRIELCRSSGPGGQNVNKRETAVRLIHLPTGLVAASQAERSQGQNR